MMTQLIVALLLSTIAGMSTTVGAVFACLVKKPTARMLSLGLGFSAGVMLTISFLEMLPSAVNSSGQLPSYLAFFVGMLIMAGLDIFVPHVEVELNRSDIDHDLMRTSKLTAIGIAIHNFPEGIITFLGTMISIEVGVLLTIAIALHNIPEGISVAVPIYYATENRKKAFKLSFLSGVAEPIGALFAAVLLWPFLNDVVLGLALALVAGIMIFLSLHELIPVAHQHSDSRRTTSFGVVAGIIVIALTLPFLA